MERHYLDPNKSSRKNTTNISGTETTGNNSISGANYCENGITTCRLDSIRDQILSTVSIVAIIRAPFRPGRILMDPVDEALSILTTGIWLWRDADKALIIQLLPNPNGKCIYSIHLWHLIHNLEFTASQLPYRVSWRALLH